MKVLKLIITLFGLFTCVNSYATVNTIINDTLSMVCVRLWHKEKKEEDQSKCWGKVYPGEQCQSTYRCIISGDISLMLTGDYRVEEIDVWSWENPNNSLLGVKVNTSDQCKNNIIQIRQKRIGGPYTIAVNPPQDEIDILRYSFYTAERAVPKGPEFRETYSPEMEGLEIDFEPL